MFKGFGREVGAMCEDIDWSTVLLPGDVLMLGQVDKQDPPSSCSQRAHPQLEDCVPSAVNVGAQLGNTYQEMMGWVAVVIFHLCFNK